MNKSIDIIVPIYNTIPTLLERCLDSIISQTYDNIRIIVIDDGSTNKDTLDIISKYKKKKGIDFYRQKNSGVSSARNLGLKKSKGDYVTFIDADDYLRKDYLSTWMELIKSKKCDVLFCGHYNVKKKAYDSNYLNEKISINSHTKRFLYNLHTFVCAGTIVDAEIAKKEKFDETIKMGEDSEYIIRLLTHSKKAYYCRIKNGYNYVQNNNSATQKEDAKALRQYIYGVNKISETLRKYSNIDNDCIDFYKAIKIGSLASKLIVHYKDKKTFVKEYKKIMQTANIKRFSIRKASEIEEIPKQQILKLILIKHGSFGLLYYMQKIKGRI